MSYSAFVFLFPLALIGWTSSEFRLQILHNNDMHAKLEETNELSRFCSEEQKRAQRCYGGFARTKAAIEMALNEAKSSQIPSLLLNGGDTFVDTPTFDAMKKWEIVSPLFDAFNFDVTTLGNHEFDDGIEMLANYIRRTQTPIVCCNLDLTTEPRLRLPQLTPSILLNVGNTKIGVIGFTTPMTMLRTRTENLIIRDEIECVQNEARRLKRSGVHIIIGLSHSGFDRDLEIAEAIPELSLIVGGHSHTLLYSPADNAPSTEIAAEEYPFVVRQKSGKIIPIVQAYAFTKYLGKLTVVFDEYGNVTSARGNPLLLNSSIPEDEEMQRLIKSQLGPLQNPVTMT